MLELTRLPISRKCAKLRGMNVMTPRAANAGAVSRTLTGVSTVNDCTTSPESDNLKRCTKCGELKPATAEHFALRATNQKLVPECRKCVNARKRGYYAKNPEREREKKRQYRKENPERVRETDRRYRANNPDRKRESGRRWREANPEKARENVLRWREANPERVRENERRWREANRDSIRENRRRWHKDNRDRVIDSRRRWYTLNADKVREYRREYYRTNRIQMRTYRHRRRAQKIQNGGTHTAADIQAQHDSQGGKCWWCGENVGDKYEVDHRIPLSRGGSNAPENLVIACRHCNRSKRDKLPHEWNGRLL